MLISALQALCDVAQALGEGDTQAKFAAHLAAHTAVVRSYLQQHVAGCPRDGVAAPAGTAPATSPHARHERGTAPAAEATEAAEAAEAAKAAKAAKAAEEGGQPTGKATRCSGGEEELISLEWSGGVDPSSLGMHAAALLLRAGLFDGEALAPQRRAVCSFVEACLTAAFPIASDAPRLSDPSKRSAAGFYTPYFQVHL